MVTIEVKTCLNLTKNVYLKFDAGRRYEISERQFIELPEGAKMVYFKGNFSKSDFLDKVEELTDDLKHCDYKVIIDGKDVTSDF